MHSSEEEIWRIIREKPEFVALRPESIKALDERVSYHTVPLAFLRNPQPPRGYGSGVLVKIDRQCFILTAGHCVRDAGEGPDNVATSIVNQVHRFYPRLERKNFVYGNGEDSVDVGYFAVDPIDAVKFEAGKRIFCQLERLHVTTSEQLLATKDWMVVGGYPAALQEIEGKILHPGLMTFVTMMAGHHGMPSSPLAAPRIGLQTLDLVVDVSQNQRIETLEGLKDFIPPPFGGASGGGCWRAFVQPDPSQWSADGIKLTGIHIASSRETIVAEDGRPIQFAREILIGHHLRMIANDFQELRKTIYSKWPFLEDRAWDVR